MAGVGRAPPAGPTTNVLVLDLPLRPYELLAAWRPESRSLSLVAPEPLQLGQRVQARISVLGLGVAATIRGRVVRVDANPLGCAVTLAPDELRLRALERLVDLAGGARMVYRTRAPRFLAEVPAIVYQHRHATRMTTFSVSEGGCGLAWSGPVPTLGTPVEIHLGAGEAVASFCGEVCWTAPSARAPTLGLKFAAGDRATWSRIIAELQRAGAPPA